MLFQDVAEQFDFQLIPRREIRVPAFTGEGMMPKTIPIKPGDAEAGPGRDHRAISIGVVRSGVQRDQILRLQRIDAVRIGFKIIDQADGVELELRRQFARINGPGQIGNLAASAAHWASHAKARAVHWNAFGFDELRYNFRQAAAFLAGISLFDYTEQLAAFGVEGGQSSAGSANVACENHGSIFLHCRPSRASNSSDSAGPHVPEG